MLNHKIDTDFVIQTQIMSFPTAIDATLINDFFSQPLLGKLKRAVDHLPKAII